jgi:hypothetical protein
MSKSCIPYELGRYHGREWSRRDESVGKLMPGIGREMRFFKMTF